MQALFAELEEVATADTTIEDKEKEEYKNLVHQYRDNQIAAEELKVEQEQLAAKCRMFHKRYGLSKFIHKDLGVQALYFIRPEKKLNAKRVEEVLPESVSMWDVMEFPKMKNLWPKLSADTRREIIGLIVNEVEGAEKLLEIDKRLLKEETGFKDEEIEALYDIVSEQEIFQVREVK